MTNRHLTEKELDKIEMLMEKEGMTISALAIRFGVSGSTIRLNLKERKLKERKSHG